MKSPFKVSFWSPFLKIDFVKSLIGDFLESSKKICSLLIPDRWMIYDNPTILVYRNIMKICSNPLLSKSVTRSSSNMI